MKRGKGEEEEEEEERRSRGGRGGRGGGGEVMGWSDGERAPVVMATGQVPPT